MGSAINRIVSNNYIEERIFPNNYESTIGTFRNYLLDFSKYENMKFSFNFTEVYRRFIQPVKTCWNSLAMCVDSVVKMRPTLRILAAEPGHDLHDIIPSDRQFDVLEELLKPLMMIKDTSERLSADRPSLHIVMCCLMNIMTLSQADGFDSKSEPYQAFVKKLEAEMLMPSRFPDFGRKNREVK